jgi:hypothetical protein
MQEAGGDVEKRGVNSSEIKLAGLHLRGQGGLYSPRAADSEFGGAAEGSNGEEVSGAQY